MKGKESIDYKDIIPLAAQGFSSKEIGKRLFVAPSTIRHYCANYGITLRSKPGGKVKNAERDERIRQFVRDNPTMPKRLVGVRFGLTRGRIWQILRSMTHTKSLLSARTSYKKDKSSTGHQT